MAGYSKYIGKVYDGRWEVIKKKYYRKKSANSGSAQFTLRNIFNGTEVVIGDRSMTRIDKGETTISTVLKNSGQLKRKYPNTKKWEW